MDRQAFIETMTSAPVKVTPAAAGTAYSLVELPWSQIAAALTIFYTMLLIIDWFWKKYLERKRRIDRDNQRREYFRRKNRLKGKQHDQG